MLFNYLYICHTLAAWTEIFYFALYLHPVEGLWRASAISGNKDMGKCFGFFSSFC